MHTCGLMGEMYELFLMKKSGNFLKEPLGEKQMIPTE